MKAHSCRFCNTPTTSVFADLGSTPLANSYIAADQLSDAEQFFPLRVLVCNECWLVQTETVVEPEAIFSEYAYFSSYSDSWVEHARQFALTAIDRFDLTPSSQVIEVASNDGYLLRHFVNKGIPVLGIEPARNVAEVARDAGVPTDAVFFNQSSAVDLIRRNVLADLLIGNNVLAHVPDINDFVGSLAKILKPNGVLSVEFPHLMKLIKERQFDTIYHEHFYYLSVTAVEKIFEKHGLRIFDIEELSTHGGSLRVMACKRDCTAHHTTTNVAKFRDQETQFGLTDLATYTHFQADIAQVRDDLMSFLKSTKESGKTVAAYGAAAKGNTLLNFCGIGSDLIEYVVDRNPYKQGRHLPGSRIPVHTPDRFAQTKPDYILILPWNLASEITHSNQHVRSWDAKFVVAVPRTVVLS
ncbi:class I SAM-dependent methyltransferase [Microvirga rosea]|uniref:class I SAM-dependent methyltransferase n=1 Tax=Microvirga rosea TaxID=2715425 RepID=UPI001D0AFE4E|nr:class I SAM-dependent methyltransferase [Microvirga rosea]MCB8823448.1 class I SAM-dependent methyltransferase [Microvirga rosea]